jgi:hypothetical protein
MRSCSKYSADIILWRPFVAIIKPRACHLIKTELGLKGHCHDPSPELIGACEMVAQKILFRVLSKKKKFGGLPAVLIVACVVTFVERKLYGLA